jgi:hypothetical protein
MVMARQRGTVGWCVAVACALLFALQARVALADDAACATQTARSTAEIVVPFGDAEHPRLPVQAVKLVPGESLCLTGDLDESGDLQHLRLAEPGGEGSAPVIQVQLERAEATRLTVSHSSKSWLYYETLELVTEQDVALATSSEPVEPGQRTLHTWNHGVRKLLLFGFRFGAAPRTRGSDLTGQREAHKRVRDTSKLNMSAIFGFWGGERRVKLGELERGLARDGYAPFRQVSVIGGLDLDFTLGRVRFGLGLGAGGRTTRQRSTGNELATWLSEGAFTAGFDLLSYEQLRVFVASGFGFASLYVDHPEGSSVFPDVRPWEGDRVEYSLLEIPFDVGTDYFVPFGRASATERWVVQFGVRVGWQQQLGQGDWKTDEKNGRDLAGPALDLSGPRARLVLGFGAQNGWQRY